VGHCQDTSPSRTPRSRKEKKNAATPQRLTDTVAAQTGIGSTTGVIAPWAIQNEILPGPGVTVRLASSKSKNTSRWILCMAGLRSNSSGKCERKFVFYYRGEVILHRLSPRSHFNDITVSHPCHSSGGRRRRASGAGAQARAGASALGLRPDVEVARGRGAPSVCLQMDVVVEVCYCTRGYVYTVDEKHSRNCPVEMHFIIRFSLIKKKSVSTSDERGNLLPVPAFR
jgi:hypothetical protein